MNMKQELSEFFDQSVIMWIDQRRREGLTYREISDLIYVMSGFRVNSKTIADWVYKAKKVP